MPIREFRLPDLGEGIAEGELVTWLVGPGDEVAEDQPVAEFETDKALVELPSPVDGTVNELAVAEGDVVPVGTVVITFDVSAEAADAPEMAGPAAEAGRQQEEAEAAPPEPSPALEPEQTAPDEVPTEPDRVERPADRPGRIVAPPSVRRLARELDVDLATIGGSGPGGRITEQDVRRAEEGSETPGDAGEPPTPAAEPMAEPGATSPEAAPRDRTLAAPATRQLATDLGVDLNEVPADREHEGQPFVTAEAVRAFAERSEGPDVAEAAAAPAEPTSPEEPGTRGDREERIPYRGVRRTIGQHMQQALATAPHVTHHDEVEVTELVELREEFKPVAQEQGVRLSYLPFVMKAIVGALKRHPRFNASLDEENEEIVLKRYYNIGVAIATDVGLLVPVVEDVDRKSMVELAAEIEELAAKARDRSITREEMTGGTFAITNYGSIGGEFATPIINHPDVAILGLGRLKDRPWVVDGAVEVRKTLRLSLAFDHRVVDGADAAAFTNDVMAYLNEPERLIME